MPVCHAAFLLTSFAIGGSARAGVMREVAHIAMPSPGVCALAIAGLALAGGLLFAPRSGGPGDPP